MADLKAGTTVGGTPVWTQGTFPLFPTGNTLLYKTFRVYTENDKPQAIDNDFVSKANGGTFNKSIQVNGNVALGQTTFMTGGIRQGNADDANLSGANVDIYSHFGLGLYSTQNNKRTVVWDTRTGNMRSAGSGTYDIGVFINSPQPTAINALTRKDYVDAAINNVVANANDRVSKAGDTMRGNLTAPKIYITSAATLDNQVPWLGQVVQRGIVLDYGTF